MSNLSDFLVGKGYGLKEVLTSSGSWNPATVGNPKKVYVRMIAGSGGNCENAGGSNATDGGDTIWDTGAVVATTTATGGDGATTTSAGASIAGMLNSSVGIGNSSSCSTVNILNSHYGTPNNPALSIISAWRGGYGELKEFEYIPNGTISYTIGAGGSEGQTDYGDGNQGAIELYY